ncbi:MAG: homocysteine S-methyltransferase family protein [Chloroflexota bacterium]
MNVIDKLTNRELVLMDGATGTELERRGVPMNDKNWSGVAVYSHPEIVQAVHEEYLDIGADVITTNTFATSRFSLTDVGLGDKTREINTNAVTLAKRARDNRAGNRDVWVAGSLSSVIFKRNPTAYILFEELCDHGREMIEIFAENEADVIVLEMVRDINFILAMVDVTVDVGLPIWVGFTSHQDEQGQTRLSRRKSTMDYGVLDDALSRLVQHPGMRRAGCAINTMHTDIQDTTPALERIVTHWDGPAGAYPNSGGFTMPNWQFVDIISPEAFVQECQGWRDMGATILGGCCGIGPEHIQLLKEHLFS